MDGSAPLPGAVSTGMAAAGAAQSPWVSVGLVFLFILIGGVFAAAEIALVSLRDSQVRRLEQSGRRGAVVAGLTRDPNRFLSAVQVGVTLSGFLASAFGASVLSDELAPVFVGWGVPESVAGPLALVLITLVISYVSIVLGELAAKRLALQRAESFALALGPMIDRIAKISRPVIWFLSKSTNVVVRLLGGDPRARSEEMSDEELRELVSAHETLGEEERAIVDEVFAAGDHLIREVMVPRIDVDFLDADMALSKAVLQVTERPHSRFPVIEGSADDVVGFVHVRDLLNPALSSRKVRVGELAREVLLLPGTKRIIPALAELRDGGHHLAIVLDEYGGTAGIVTLEDLVEELIGDIRDEYDVAEEKPSRRLVSGEMEVDGRLNLNDFREETGLVVPEGAYETIAGFVVARLGHIPSVGESIDLDAPDAGDRDGEVDREGEPAGPDESAEGSEGPDEPEGPERAEVPESERDGEPRGHRFTVTAMDGYRVSRIRVTALP